MDQIQGLKQKQKYIGEDKENDDHFKFSMCKDTEMEKRTSVFQE